MAAAEQETAMLLKEEETYVLLNQPGTMFLQDPLQFEEPSLHLKQDVDLKLEMDGSEHKDLVYPSSMNIKEEIEDGMNQEDCVKREIESTTTPVLVPFLPKEEPFLEDPLRTENPGLHIKEDPELKMDVDGSEHNVVASRSYASKNTRLIQSNRMCDFPCEVPARQGMSQSELDIGSEGSTHIAKFREEEEEAEEEESVSAPKLKCSMTEDKSQIFSCSFCLQNFASKYRLISHVFVHIDGVQPPKFVCKSCGKVFPSYVSLKKHLKISEPDQDSSADTEETFNCIREHGSIYLQHVQKDCAMDQTKRKCSSNETPKSFTEKCNTPITTHIAEIRDRNDNNGSSDISRKVNVNNVPHVGKRSRKCDVCGKSFTYLTSLKKHALIHQGSHNCDVCGKFFAYLSNLKTHALIHTGLKPHKCDICGKSFSLLCNLETHTLIHTGTKSHRCDICGKCFTQSSHLKTHALMHKGLKPHKCGICGKSFTELSNVKRHELIHTKVRSHKCDICDKSFTRSGTLKIHALIHTGEKPHQCDICGKCFTDLGNLKSHALIHTGTKRYRCDICGKYFSQSCSVKRHALTHTGSKPYKCDICSKSFTDVSSLRKHTLIHTGSRPHKCVICGKSYTILGNLKTHRLTHTLE